MMGGAPGVGLGCCKLSSSSSSSSSSLDFTFFDLFDFFDSSRGCSLGSASSFRLTWIGDCGFRNDLWRT